MPIDYRGSKLADFDLAMTLILDATHPLAALDNKMCEVVAVTEHGAWVRFSNDTKVWLDGYNLVKRYPERKKKYARYEPVIKSATAGCEDFPGEEY